jgi:hypothetical protein
MMAQLCVNSSGGWVNYGLQAFVFGAILLGRALDRVVDEVRWPSRRVAFLGVASIIALTCTARNVYLSASLRSRERAMLRALFDDPRVTVIPGELYFEAVPQYNRLYGRLDLAHDDWLYRSYEAADAAEPRSRWLRTALTDGSVRQVIVPGIHPTVGGLSERLPDLGYVFVARYGHYIVWERPDRPDRLADRGRAN